MERFKYLVIGFCLLVSGCGAPPADTVFQVSTIDALMAGVYDGDVACRSLLNHGDLGVGTFNELDGEMIVLEGKLYQIKSDGKVYKPELSIKTPFASVCNFNPDIEFPIAAGSDFGKMKELIDNHASNQNLIHAIKITGQFRSMRTRNVPRQNRPYPPLIEATAHQPEFNMENISGTIVGFRLPAYVKGINIPGYHLHFLSNDQTCGGHILDLELVQGTCEIDILHQCLIKLPESDTAFARTDLTKDRSRELRKVEGGESRQDTIEGK